MKDWEDYYAENAKMIAANEEKNKSSGGGIMSLMGGGMGGGFDPGGQMQTEGFKSYRAGERQDYSSMMNRGLGGSKTFTADEIRQGYRNLGKG